MKGSKSNKDLVLKITIIGHHSPSISMKENLHETKNERTSRVLRVEFH